ncbi:MAG: beta strand repeat-containing protein, partial [Dolichospermum sp.]
TITINGTFVTRDPDGFIGSNAAIPTITPILGSTSSIQYLLSGGQIIQNTTYANLVLGGSGTKTISTNIPSISGTVTIQDAAVVNSGSSVFGGTGTNLVMNGTGRLIVGGNRIVPDMLGAYTLNDGTIEFNGNNALHQIRAGVTYKNLLVSGANVQVESGNINLSSGGSFTVDSSANVAFTNQQIIATAASVNVNIYGSLSTADQDGFFGNANTTITSANINLTLGTNSTIHYNRVGAQMISAFNYANITISGNRSNATITLPSGTVGVSAALVVTATNANYIITNDTIHFNGSMAQSIPVLPYNFLRLSNSGVKTLVGNIQCDNGLQVQTGATLNASQFTIIVGANSSVIIAGTFITSNINGFSDSNNSAIRTNNNTVFTLTNSTIEYNATVAQIVTARNDYHNLTITNSGTKTVNGDIVVNGTLLMNSGVFDISNSSLTFQNGNTPISRVSGTKTTKNNKSLNFGTTSFKNGNAFVIPNQLFTSATPFLRSFVMNRNNSITLNNQFFQLTHRLIISSGELILPVNYTFTLKSTSINNTALVAQIGGTITYLTGAAFVVERFFPRNHAKNN